MGMSSSWYLMHRPDHLDPAQQLRALLRRDKLVILQRRDGRADRGRRDDVELNVLLLSIALHVDILI